MDSIEFILIIAVFAGVLFWYFQNLKEGADGGAGLLALRQDLDEEQQEPSDPAPHTRRRYRARQRASYSQKNMGGRFSDRDRKKRR